MFRYFLLSSFNFHLAASCLLCLAVTVSSSWTLWASVLCQDSVGTSSDSVSSRKTSLSILSIYKSLELFLRVWDLCFWETNDLCFHSILFLVSLLYLNFDREIWVCDLWKGQYNKELRRYLPRCFPNLQSCLQFFYICLFGDLYNLVMYLSFYLIFTI